MSGSGAGSSSGSAAPPVGRGTSRGRSRMAQESTQQQQQQQAAAAPPTQPQASPPRVSQDRTGTRTGPSGSANGQKSIASRVKPTTQYGRRRQELLEKDKSDLQELWGIATCRTPLLTRSKAGPTLGSGADGTQIDLLANWYEVRKGPSELSSGNKDLPIVHRYQVTINELKTRGAYAGGGDKSAAGSALADSTDRYVRRKLSRLEKREILWVTVKENYAALRFNPYQCFYDDGAMLLSLELINLPSPPVFHTVHTPTGESRPGKFEVRLQHLGCEPFSAEKQRTLLEYYYPTGANGANGNGNGEASQADIRLHAPGGRNARQQETRLPSMTLHPPALAFTQPRVGVAAPDQLGPSLQPLQVMQVIMTQNARCPFERVWDCLQPQVVRGLQVFIAGLKVCRRNITNEAPPLGSKPQHRTCTQLIEENAMQKTFEWTRREEGREPSTHTVSVFDYYKKQYNFTIRYPGLPLMQFGKSKSRRVIHMPLELLTVVPQRLPGRLTPQVPELNASIIRKAAVPAPERKDLTEKLVALMFAAQKGYRQHAFMKNAGLKVASQMQKVCARIMRPVEPLYGRLNPTDKPVHTNTRDGTWRLPRAPIFRGPPKKINCAIVTNVTNSNAMNSILPCIDNLMRTLSDRGVIVNVLNRQQPMVLPNASYAFLRENIKPKLQSPTAPNMMIYVMQAKSADFYGAMKRVAELECGIIAQCMLIGTTNKAAERPNNVTCENLMMKIVAKMGGVPNAIRCVPRCPYGELFKKLNMIPRVEQCGETHPLVGLPKSVPRLNMGDNINKPDKDCTMIMALDVTHPTGAESGSTASSDGGGGASLSSTRGASIAACVANVTGDCLHWGASHRVQRANRESIVYGGHLFRERLLRFWESTGALPKRIVVIRDGVSEGEYTKVLSEELRSLQAACKFVSLPTRCRREATRSFVVAHARAERPQAMPQLRMDQPSYVSSSSDEERSRSMIGEKPERDLVDDGKGNKITKSEARELQEPVRPSYVKPKITYVVVNKRHGTRLYCADPRQGQGKAQNAPAGTVVDNVITHPDLVDFYMIPHYGIQGTSKPVHFTVLHDENGFSLSELECLMYSMCHLFYRCARVISVPAPTRYAHLAAERAKVLYKALGLDQLEVLAAAGGGLAEAAEGGSGGGRSGGATEGSGGSYRQADLGEDEQSVAASAAAGASSVRGVERLSSAMVDLSVSAAGDTGSPAADRSAATLPHPSASSTKSTALVEGDSKSQGSGSVKSSVKLVNVLSGMEELASDERRPDLMPQYDSGQRLDTRQFAKEAELLMGMPKRLQFVPYFC